MEKYLYLTKESWVDAWVNGGSVPLFLASTYRKREREGIYTPDENLIVQTNLDPKLIPPEFFSEDLQVKNLNFHGNMVNGVLAPNITGDRYQEDGVILSLSNVKSLVICQRLKKAACVAISEVDLLKAVIDKQLGIEGIAGPCKYTSDHNRNHFLKSIDDAWQEEFRLFWLIPNKVNIELPPGIATRTEV